MKDQFRTAMHSFVPSSNYANIFIRVGCFVDEKGERSSSWKKHIKKNGIEQL